MIYTCAFIYVHLKKVHKTSALSTHNQFVLFFLGAFVHRDSAIFFKPVRKHFDLVLMQQSATAEVLRELCAVECMHVHMYMCVHVSVCECVRMCIFMGTST